MASAAEAAPSGAITSLETDVANAAPAGKHQQDGGCQPRAILLSKAQPSSSSLSKNEGSEGTLASCEAPSQLPPQPCCSRGFWRTLLRYLGPGFFISMAYIDPGNMAADINQGLSAGYKLIWVTLWSTVMGFVIQMLAAKLGIATERHLAEHCRSHYPPVPRLLLWAVTELAIVACDMIEVIGGAAALYTLSNGAVPLWAGVLITAASAFATLCLERYGMRLLEAILMSLILVMSGTLGFMFFSSGVPYGQVAEGLAVPRLSVDTIPYAVGAMGAIIMPHNLYLHSALVLSRADDIHRSTVADALRYVRIESGLALALALVINIFVISVFANAFYGVLTTDDVGLVNAGQLLGGVYGRHMQYIWGAGLLAAANASTVTSTYAGQVVMTGFLRIKVSVFWRTAAVRLSTLGPTLLVAVLLGSNGSSLSGLTEWLNVIQSLVLPFVVIPLLIFTSSKTVMGAHVNRRWVVIVMALVVAFLVGMNGYLAVSFAMEKLPATPWAWALFGIGCALYCTFAGYLLAGPTRCERWMQSAKAAATKMRSSMPPVGRAVDMMDGM